MRYGLARELEKNMITKLNWMNRLLLLIFSFFLMSSCSQGKNQDKDNNGNLTVSGTVKNPQDGAILLQELQNNEMVTIDSVELTNKNDFQFAVAVSEPGFYRLNFYGNQYVNFILNDEDVEITADGQSAEGVAEVKGSRDTDHFYSVNAIMQDFQKEVQALELEFQQASMEGDEAKVDSLRKEYVKLDEKKSEKVKEAIDNMEDNSLSALYAVNFLDPEKDFPFFDKLAQKVEKGMPNSKYAQQYVASVSGMRTLAIGQMAPDIALPTPEGDTVALSSLRGKYVLIDFWAAWCRPCRIENPNVVRMYHKYNDKGFEVFGVSLDRNKKDWVEAIKADGLVWTQVSDLQYFNSAAARLYNIQAIPATYLIDPEGKIIAKNLRGSSLEEKLAEVLL